MAFTKINAAGIGSTETVTLDGLTVINDGSFGGNVSVGGTLTYEDVTNIDSVGLITARAGVVVGSGITLSKDGDGFFTGIVTATSFSGSGTNLTGIDTDLVSDTSPQLGGDLASNGNDILFADNDKAIFGTGSDLKIYHNGTDNYIMPSNGKLIINNGSETLAQFTSNGAAELYHDNSKTAYTHGSGFNIKGGNTSDQTELRIFGNEGRNAEILLAADDGDDNADYWKIMSSNDNSFYLQNYAAGSYETNLKATGNGAVELYHDNSKRFETTANGFTLTGDQLIMGTNGQVPTLKAGGTNTDIRVQAVGAGGYIELNTNSTARWRVGGTNGEFFPVTDNTYDIGASSYRVRNIYTADLHCSNRGSKNDVDGTWGDYTIQEGESDLFLINNRNGKKYKFNLTEVS